MRRILGFGGLLGLVACAGPAEGERVSGRVDDAQAEAAVRRFIYDWKPTMNRNMELPVAEFEAPELWSRLGVQIYKIDPDQQILGSTSFVIQDGVAHSIGAGLGGHGVMSAVAADLDQDGRDELVYSYSWGSGIHRTQFAVWKPEAAAGERERVAPTSFAHGDVRLHPRADGGLDLLVAPYREGAGWGADTHRLGELRWDAERAAPTVVLDPRLEPTLRNQLWTSEG